MRNVMTGIPQQILLGSKEYEILGGRGIWQVWRKTELYAGIGDKA
jgi:hypothetical protein